jgi:hypothetical protein
MFSTIPRVLGAVLMFCAPGIIFGGTEGVRSRFHVLRSRTIFRWYQGRQDPFLYFALPDLFSTVPKALGPVFMFCAPGLIFGGTEGLESRFHVLLSRIRFRRHQGRRVPFSCFALRNSIFGGTEDVGSRFHVLRLRTRFRRYRWHSSSFNVLRFWTHFLRSRGRWVPFSYFVLPDSFSKEPMA